MFYEFNSVFYVFIWNCWVLKLHTDVVFIAGNNDSVPVLTAVLQQILEAITCYSAELAE